MNIIYLIIILQVLITIYLIYKTRKLEKFETNADIIKTSVDNKYKFDIDAFRNLISLSKHIYNNNRLLIPATNFQINDLNITDEFIVDGNINFTNKNINYLDIYPRYMVIAWFNSSYTSIPKGWSKCDGTKYKLVDGVTISTHSFDSEGIQTPDLRGRFILGEGTSPGLTSRRLDEYGGEANAILSENQIPRHTHSSDNFLKRVDQANGITSYYTNVSHPKHYFDTDVTIGHAGWSNSHNNMPPYFVLIYIMKL